jgi:hypothetical protein
MGRAFRWLLDWVELMICMVVLMCQGAEVDHNGEDDAQDRWIAMRQAQDDERGRDNREA